MALQWLAGLAGWQAGSRTERTERNATYGRPEGGKKLFERGTKEEAGKERRPSAGGTLYYSRRSEKIESNVQNCERGIKSHRR